MIDCNRRKFIFGMSGILIGYEIYESDIQNMFKYHNQTRKDHRLQILGLSEKLSFIASEYAKLLSDNDILSHNLNGNVGYRLSKQGYNDRNCGENLARSSFLMTDNDVFNMWMKSPGHRKNILGRFSEMGISRYGFTWVTIFGTPQ